MITWPAVIKYSGEDELLFIRDGAHWAGDKDLNSYYYHSDDRLIDVNGALFSLDKGVNSLHKTLPMSEFESWIKNHMVILNQCCSSKLSFTQYSQGLLLVEQLCDER